MGAHQGVLWEHGDGHGACCGLVGVSDVYVLGRVMQLRSLSLEDLRSMGR